MSQDKFQYTLTQPGVTEHTLQPAARPVIDSGINNLQFTPPSKPVAAQEPSSPGAFEEWYDTKFKHGFERGPNDKYVARNAWFAALNIQRAENDSLKEVIRLSEDSRLMDEYLKLERANARQAERIAELEKGVG